MRDLAHFGKNDPVWRHAIVEILAAQVIATAIYKGIKLNNLEEIKQFQYRVAGYPVLEGPADGVSIEDESANRVAYLLNIKWPE